MTRYRIEPGGVAAVVNAVNEDAARTLTAHAKDLQRATTSAEAHLDPLSPVRGALGPFALAAGGQIKAVYSATTTVLRATATATNAYVEADLDMARAGEAGVTVTATYVAGNDGDRASQAGRRAVQGLANIPKQEAMDARETPSLTDWLDQVTKP
ncbi:hypothetical protein AWW66_00205 [Micromonospora rosaria]|uniref:Uncharacterized protein n=1 Tax=Micromonospora rosaria TaxID=47874 RepID=A0A136Q028_9ACTN|nr:DUF6507 family protein [Micromonospora rosaria]KXK63914.1 hypothetical protein AWW66_00205 [Micromonospora rosaria]